MIDFYLASVLLVGLMGMWCFVYGVAMVFMGSTSYQGSMALRIFGLLVLYLILRVHDKCLESYFVWFYHSLVAITWFKHSSLTTAINYTMPEATVV